MPRSQKKRGPRVEHDPEILRGIARGPWCVYWATQREEEGKSFSGQDIYEVAPEVPRWAERWAKKLADSIIELNGASLIDLYARATGECGYSRDRESFGVHLGMQATGAGIRWEDAARGGDLKILVPDYELYGRGCELAEPDLRFVSK